MTAYSILEITPQNLDWVEDYRPATNRIIARHGGRYLARTAEHVQLEGASRDVGLRVIIEWPSMAAARAFESDPDYAPHLKSRLDNTQSTHVVIAGADDLS